MFQVGQLFEIYQPHVGDFGADESKRSQLCRPRYVLEPLVGDLATLSVIYFKLVMFL